MTQTREVGRDLVLLFYIYSRYSRKQMWGKFSRIAAKIMNNAKMKFAIPKPKEKAVPKLENF